VAPPQASPRCCRLGPLSSRPNRRLLVRRTSSRPDADVRGPVLALLRLNLVVSLAPSANSEWTVGLAAWIIQDGNYDDFAVGDHAEFALQCYPEGLAPVRAGTKHQAMQVAEDLYQITASVVHVGDHGWVLDFGLLAYGDTAPPGGAAAGQVLAGRAALGSIPSAISSSWRRTPGTRIWSTPGMSAPSAGRLCRLCPAVTGGFVMSACEAGPTCRPRTLGPTTTATPTTYSAVNCCPCPPSVRVPPPGRTTQAEGTAP
jgi:hypothetical protein